MDWTPNRKAAMDAPRMHLYDMHCHLDFVGNAHAVVQSAATLGMGCYSGTVTPQGYLSARLQLGACPNVTVGLGLHPWWLADGSCTEDDVALFEELASGTQFVNEVGLDFAPRREGTFELQTRAFDRIVQCCAHGGKTISIHAVRSADTVLDVLERHACTQHNTCVFHWFSGSSDELVRAVRLGCWFSFGTRTLATKRGRAYARSVPAERLLIETDWPDDPVDQLDPASWTAVWHSELEHAARLMAQARNVEVDELTEQLALNSRATLQI